MSAINKVLRAKATVSEILINREIQSGYGERGAIIKLAQVGPFIFVVVKTTYGHKSIQMVAEEVQMLAAGAAVRDWQLTD